MCYKILSKLKFYLLTKFPNKLWHHSLNKHQLLASIALDYLLTTSDNTIKNEIKNGILLNIPFFIIIGNIYCIIVNNLIIFVNCIVIFDNYIIFPFT